MARMRTVKPGFFINDTLAEIDPLGRLLFIGLWCLADREGRLEDRIKPIKMQVLPYDDADVDALLNDLVARDFIVRYAVSGKRYIQIANFKKHQSPHIREAKSEIPGPDSIPAEHQTSPVLAPDKPGAAPALTVAGVGSMNGFMGGSGHAQQGDGVSAPTSTTASTTASADVVSLAEWIAQKTKLPNKPDVLDQIAEMVKLHMERDLSENDIRREIGNIIDTTDPKHKQRGPITVKFISNWLARAVPAADTRHPSPSRPRASPQSGPREPPPYLTPDEVMLPNWRKQPADVASAVTQGASHDTRTA